MGTLVEISDWKYESLSDFCGGDEFIIDGPFGSNLKNEHYVNSGVPVLTGGNISRNTWHFKNIRFISHKKAEELSRCNVVVGDLLSVKIGSVGFTALVTDLGGFPLAIIPANLLRLRVNNSKSDPDFLKHVLQFENTKKQLLELATSTAQPALNLRKFRALKIAVPTLGEQKVIAKSLSDVDKLIATIKEELHKKKNFKIAMTQELLSQAKGLNAKLGNYAEFSKGNNLPKSSLSETGTYKAIHYGELFTHYPEKIKQIKSSTNQTNLPLVFSRTNDVLMPTSDVTPNGLATASCIVEEGVVLGGDILIIRADDSLIDGTYLSYLIRNSKDKVLKLVNGTTVYHIYGKDLSNFEFILPSISYQKESVRALEIFSEEISLLETELAKYECIKQGMAHDLLTGKVRLV